jgi:hypothetical protein
MQTLEHQGHHGSASSALPAGLTVSQDGYTIELENTVADRDREATLRFRITGPVGQVVHSYDVTHERRLHLIVVRRDFAHYEHVHPTIDDTGMWAVTTKLPLAGTYRMFADFRTQGKPLTLGADLFVAGPFQPAPTPPSVLSHRFGEYEVALQPSADAGLQRELAFVVSRNGAAVTDLTPYLGAMGHLVALREGDLAFLHVHPLESGEAGPEIRFHAGFPSAGRYRLFLEFAHAGRVRLAPFVLDMPQPSSSDAFAQKQYADQEQRHGHHH